MKKEQEIVRIELTPEQKQLVKKEIGKDAEAVELTATSSKSESLPASHSERQPLNESHHFRFTLHEKS